MKHTLRELHRVNPPVGYKGSTDQSRNKNENPKEKVSMVEPVQEYTLPYSNQEFSGSSLSKIKPGCLRDSISLSKYIWHLQTVSNPLSNKTSLARPAYTTLNIKQTTKLFK